MMKSDGAGPSGADWRGDSTFPEEEGVERRGVLGREVEQDGVGVAHRGHRDGCVTRLRKRMGSAKESEAGGCPGMRRKGMGYLN